MIDKASATVQFTIDEIMGRKVKPVEKQIFESRASRMPLLLSVVLWSGALITVAIAAAVLAAMFQVFG